MFVNVGYVCIRNPPCNTLDRVRTVGTSCFCANLMKLPILFVPHPASSCQIVNPKPFLSRAKPPKLMHGAPTCECHSRPSNISARLHCRQSGRHHGTVHLKLTSAKSQLWGKLSEIAYVPLLACADVQLTLHYTVVQCHNIKKKKNLRLSLHKYHFKYQ